MMLLIMERLLTRGIITACVVLSTNWSGDCTKSEARKTFKEAFLNIVRMIQEADMGTAIKRLFLAFT